MVHTYLGRIDVEDPLNPETGPTAATASSQAPRFSSTDVPRLRHELAEFYGGPPGPMFYENAILTDRQPLRPPGPADRAAKWLAAAEAARLRIGDLWYIDDDLCALLNAAHPSMPVFAPQPHDLPSKVGFAVFAEPIFSYPAIEARDEATETRMGYGDTEADRQLGRRLAEKDTPIVAVSWGPMDNPHWPAGGLWMSFYTPASDFADVGLSAAAARRARAMLPRMFVDNEVALAWRPEGADPAGYQLPTLETDRSTSSWARLVFATFILAKQINLAETGTGKTDRAQRRRAQAAGLPERDTRIVRLRRSVAAARGEEQDGDGGPAWRHRWIVRGHWRNQWYPTLQDNRPLWIAPYLKGPGGAPLLGGSKVIVASSPSNPMPDGE